MTYASVTFSCETLTSCSKTRRGEGRSKIGSQTMFARTALRAAGKPVALTQRFGYATAATSSPAHFSAQAVEQTNAHGMEISRAQRIATDGFVSGKPTPNPKIT